MNPLIEQFQKGLKDNTINNDPESNIIFRLGCLLGASLLLASFAKVEKDMLRTYLKTNKAHSLIDTRILMIEYMEEMADEINKDIKRLNGDQL